MKRNILTISALFILTAIQGFSEEGPATKRFIVVFDASATPEEMQGMIHGNGGGQFKSLPLIHGAVFQLPAQASPQALQAIAEHRKIVSLHADVEVFIDGKPSGGSTQPPQTLPWGVDRIDAELAVGTGMGVKVAVIDTGISLTHPDLKVAGGFNCIQSTASANDDNGHGSHVAGTIAALQNTIGAVGVAPSASLYAVKVLNKRGSGWASDIIEGLGWCVTNGMDVANMSFGGTGTTPEYALAIKNASDAGVILVAAAGNEAKDVLTSYPAAYPEVIAISACDAAGKFASFSNFGSKVEFIAPGVSIYSTWKGTGYNTISGTSMASPHAVGTVALLLEDYPGLPLDGVRVALRATAENLGLSAGQQGAGLVDAQQAASYAP